MQEKAYTGIGIKLYTLNCISVPDLYLERKIYT